MNMDRGSFTSKNRRSSRKEKTLDENLAVRKLHVHFLMGHGGKEYNITKLHYALAISKAFERKMNRVLYINLGVLEDQVIFTYWRKSKKDQGRAFGPSLQGDRGMGQSENSSGLIGQDFGESKNLSQLLVILKSRLEEKTWKVEENIVNINPYFSWIPSFTSYFDFYSFSKTDLILLIDLIKNLGSFDQLIIQIPPFLLFLYLLEDADKNFYKQGLCLEDRLDSLHYISPIGQNQSPISQNPSPKSQNRSQDSRPKSHDPSPISHNKSQNRRQNLSQKNLHQLEEGRYDFGQKAGSYNPGEKMRQGLFYKELVKNFSFLEDRTYLVRESDKKGMVDGALSSLAQKVIKLPHLARNMNELNRHRNNLNRNNLNKNNLNRNNFDGNMYGLNMADRKMMNMKMADLKMLAINQDMTSIEKLSYSKDLLAFVRDWSVEKEDMKLDSDTAYILRTAQKELIELRKNPFYIGKSLKDADYVVTDNSMVSRIHAYILRSGSEFYLVDNKATNKTRLGRTYLKPYDKALIQDGDVFYLANESFQFRIGKTDDQEIDKLERGSDDKTQSKNLDLV